MNKKPREIDDSIDFSEKESRKYCEKISDLELTLEKQKKAIHKYEVEHGRSLALLFETEFQKGELARLNEELLNIQNELLEKARKAGQADVAISVVHNIGNFMNSVSVSAGIISTLLSNPVLDRLKKLNRFIEDKIPKINDYVVSIPPDSTQLKPYNLYKICTKALEEEHQRVISNLLDLMKGVTHIKNYLDVQRSYITEKSNLELIKVTNVIESTLSIQDEMISSNHIDMQKKFDKNYTISAVKTKLIYILSNLLENSIEALIEGKNKKRVIKIRTKNDEKYVSILFSDNGCGIRKENLTNIFSPGFSTKEGRYGFGLHSCANFMTEMGGKISAESEGEGKGTTLTLVFPL